MSKKIKEPSKEYLKLLNISNVIKDWKFCDIPDIEAIEKIRQILDKN